MGDFLTAVGILHREVEGRLINTLNVNAPTLGRVGEGLVQLHELCKVVVIERIGLTHVSSGIKLVVPNFACGCAFLKEQHNGLNPSAQERAAGTVEHGMQIAAFQQMLAEADGGIVGVTQECVLDDDAGAATGFEDFDVMLEKEVGGLASADGEILLHFLAFLAAEGRIGLDDVVPVFFLNVGEVFGERVGVNYVRRIDAVQYHVHNADNVGEGLLFLAVECTGLEEAILRDGSIGIGFLHVVERLAVEARRAEGAIVDAFAEFRLHDLNDGADERARGVVFAAVSASVAHVLDLGFVKVGELMLFNTGTEA